jgi:hypothetical protein
VSCSKQKKSNTFLVLQDNFILFPNVFDHDVIPSTLCEVPLASNDIESDIEEMKVRFSMGEKNHDFQRNGSDSFEKR